MTKTERAVPETRTGPAIQALVEGVRKDITDIVASLETARAHMGALEGQAKGVNGLSSGLKAQGTQLDEILRNVREMADSAERALTGRGKPEITERVAAKEADDA